MKKKVIFFSADHEHIKSFNVVVVKVGMCLPYLIAPNRNRQKEHIVNDLLGLIRSGEKVIFIIGVDGYGCNIDHEFIATSLFQQGHSVARYVPAGERGMDGKVEDPSLDINHEGVAWEFVYTRGDDIDFIPNEVRIWSERDNS